MDSLASLVASLHDAIYAVMTPVSDFIWSYILVYLLLGAGVLFTVLTRGMQFRLFGHMARVTFNSRGAGEGVSGFQAFATSLAARVGTGNLAGVAIALWVGGPGAIFWMWVTALVGFATSFVESTLAQVYKKRHEDGVFRGGPAYYIERTLGWRWMSLLFAFFLLVAYGLAFNGAQANTIAQGMNQAFGMPNWLTGLILVGVVAVVIYGGLKSIARTAEKIVPVMAVAYLLVALVVLAVNITEVPEMLALIVKSAFGYGPAVGGAAGYAIKTAMENGIKRGLFSNEAGMGSAPNAAAQANVKHPAAQGLVQSFGVFVDTLVICSCTAVVILLSGVYETLMANSPGQDIVGIQLTQDAMADHFGGFGEIFIAVAILLFAFTSIIANFSFATVNIEYMFKRHAKGAVQALRLAVLAMVMIGSVSQLTFVWDFADLSMGLMATTNLIAILILAPIAMRVLKDYERQRREGVREPRFDPKVLKRPEQVDADVWPPKDS
ncbi:alanine/glycine:cation symporter family protein [Chromohalobacter israelensis]|uniref:alanine/glycine:cation symporter family protein n=1 Tax=Chromohalobacter israelensis TaxID=141390 RepID=UPI000D713D77|nr:sodium:alanine symporter family protein [Chromohalobacter salexigens]NWO57603.1 sodium:alanine symporter family protein [Chromohalobacter salexigens]PWW39066.1 AGCS family alanine or glycine:cation symporter [Chromohalobacter salexigens]RXE49525.1 sodium:alanine symporter family protein [Chromohalobacter salexigens]